MCGKKGKREKLERVAGLGEVVKPFVLGQIGEFLEILDLELTFQLFWGLYLCSVPAYEV